jgi:CRISPR-associated protein Cas2
MMNYLISYDIATDGKSGQNRLRAIAQVCKDFGQRVQYSVFEFDIDDGQFEILKNRLLNIFEPDEDSIRIYKLRGNREDVVECYGVDKYEDFNEPLLF